MYFKKKIQAKEMMQECAAKWRSMDDEDKKPYQAMADKDKDRWTKEKAAEKKPKDQFRPKRPPSAYFLFLKESFRTYFIIKLSKLTNYLIYNSWHGQKYETFWKMVWKL